MGPLGLQGQGKVGSLYLQGQRKAGLLDLLLIEGVSSRFAGTEEVHLDL